MALIPESSHRISASSAASGATARTRGTVSDAGFSFSALLWEAQARRGSLSLTLAPPPSVIEARRAMRGAGSAGSLTTISLRQRDDTGATFGPARDIIQDALRQLEKPYVFGAHDFSDNPSAFDCSSLTKWLYQRHDISLPRTAQQQYQSTRPVSASEAQSGDLIFFRDTYASTDTVTHVGILLDGHQMVSAAGRGVGVQSLENPYWASRLVGFGRPVATAASAIRPAASDFRLTSLEQVAPLSLNDFPKPTGDNGRGLHWVPTTSSRPDVVDRFVKEAREMDARWMVFLNDGAQIGANDYLVKQLVANGIMPIMRIYTPHGEPIRGDLEELVRHYKALGVPYFQLFNEPNLKVENPDGKPNVKRYVEQWLDAARQVVAGGGLPGFGALAPGGDYDDRAFFRRALTLLRDQGDASVLGRTWVALHNYTFNQPLDHDSDSYGFKAFKVYDDIVREVLGHPLPVIGTEGGAVLGNQFNKGRPPVTEQTQAEIAASIYRYMEQQREPYNFAYTTWVIANEAGGGSDPGFERHALFLSDRARPIVSTLKHLA